MTPIENHPDLWRADLPVPELDGHKYHRGFVGIYGAPDLIGATRLAAGACSRIGAGLVSVVASKRADVYRVCLPPDLMVQDVMPDKADVGLGGSGGISEDHFDQLVTGAHFKARIFDADALTSRLKPALLDGNCVLTPHRGEFERVFGKIEGDLSLAAQQAAAQCGAVIVLKSRRTIIAGANGTAVVRNDHASPYLAKAGTGDVLAGLIAGLVAQNMTPFAASCAAVWIHGEAALQLGPGLIAGDIADMIPAILQDLLSQRDTA